MKIAAYSTIYLIQVITGKEHLYVRHVRNLLDDQLDFQLLIPSRKLTHRRKGKQISVVKPIFPGYIFLVCDAVQPQTRQLLKRVHGFVRLITNENGDLAALSPKDRQLLIRLTATGETTARSLVTFDTNNRVVPLSGPLKSCEGEIIKIDRRKRRAKVKFVMHDKRFLIDFEYEELKKADESDEESTP